MRRCAELCFTLLLISFTSFAQTYITNVTLVDVEKLKLVPGQTIVIDKERITKISPAKKLSAPAGVQVID